MRAWGTEHDGTCGARHRLDRRECVDHVIVLNAAGLHRVLTDYVMYHIALANTSLAWQGHAEPASVTPPSAGRTVAIPEVGGLHHRYDRIAASIVRLDPSYSRPYHPSVQHISVSLNSCRCPRSREHRQAHGEDSHADYGSRKEECLYSYQLFDRH